MADPRDAQIAELKQELRELREALQKAEERAQKAEERVRLAEEALKQVRLEQLREVLQGALGVALRESHAHHRSVLTGRCGGVFLM